MAGASQIGLSGSSPLTRPFKGPSRLAGGITYQFNEKLRLAASFLSSSWSGLAVLEHWLAVVRRILGGEVDPPSVRIESRSIGRAIGGPVGCAVHGTRLGPRPVCRGHGHA